MSKAEEPTAAVLDAEPSPPAYDENEEAQPPPDYVQGDSSTAATPSLWKPLRLHTPFPGVLSLFFEKWLPTSSDFIKGRFTAMLCTGEDEDKPVYVVQLNTSDLSNMKPVGYRRGVCLRNGLDEHDPVIGAALDASAIAPMLFSFNSHSHILLPPLGESTSPVRERMSASTAAGMGVTFRFSIEVGTEKVRREDFEWRKIKRGGGHDSEGYELFRVSSTSTNTGSGNGGGSSSTSRAESRNEGDVLAIISWPKAWWVRKRDFTLKFRGAGLTGELGDRWSLMVVLTTLRIWWMRWDGRTTWMSVGIGQQLWGDGDAKQT